MNFDVTTLAGRRALDEAVKRLLPAAPKTPGTHASRTDIAIKLDMDTEKGLRAVSASLARGLRDGWAASDGRGAWRRYRRSP